MSRKSNVQKKRSIPSTLLPLGALAAGFGLASGAMAQAAAPAAPAASAAEASAPENALPVVRAKASAERAGKDDYQAVDTRIGKGKQEIRDIPQSITVMTERLIDDRRIDTLKEALHHTAGISFAATENGTDQDIRLRGFPIATVGDLFIDGMRDPSQYDRDAFNFDRIEVMRGSASMLFGRGSTGGVINQVSKQPRLITENYVETSVGSRDYFRSTGDFNVKTGDDSAFRVNAMITKADNDGAKIDKYGIAPTYRWGIGTADEFSVGAFLLNVDNVPMAGTRWLSGSVPDLKPGAFYGFASDQLLGKASYGTLSHVHRFNDGGELRTQLRSGTFDRRQWSSTAGFAAGTTAANLNDSTVVTRSGLTPRQDQYKTSYLQSDYSNKFNWFGLKHEVLTGVDAASERADRDSAVAGTVPTAAQRPPTTVGRPNDGVSIPNTIQWRNSSGYKSRSFGAYFQDVVQVAEYWKVVGGLRFDSFKGDFVTIPATGASTTTHLSDSLFSPRLGVLFQPTATSSFHLSYGSSFNTSADTYQYVTPLAANTPPEKSRNLELGAKLDWLEGKLSTSVAIFRSEKYNERNNDQDTAGTQYLLSGARHSQGIEVDVVGRPAQNWEVYASLSYIPVAKIDKVGSSGNPAQIGPRVGLTPKASGSLWVSYQATPKLRVAGGMNGASRVYPLTVAGANSAPKWVVADAMAEYQLTQQVMMQFNVTNIANKLYGDQLYPGFVVSGAPRTYKLTLGVGF